MYAVKAGLSSEWAEEANHSHDFDESDFRLGRDRDDGGERRCERREESSREEGDATNGRRSDDSAATADAPMQCVMPVLASAMIAISVSATSPAWALESDAGDDADVVAAAIARCRTQTCVDLLSRPANAKKLTREQRLEQWRDRRKSFARREAQDVTTFSKERQFQMRYERAYVLKSLAEQC